jgi:hypothetical protein
MFPAGGPIWGATLLHEARGTLRRADADAVLDSQEDETGCASCLNLCLFSTYRTCLRLPNNADLRLSQAVWILDVVVIIVMTGRVDSDQGGLGGRRIQQALEDLDNRLDGPVDGMARRVPEFV